MSYQREYHYGKKREFSTSLVKFLVLCVCFVLSEYQTINDSGPERGAELEKPSLAKKRVPWLSSHQTIVQCSESVKQTKNIYNLS